MLSNSLFFSDTYCTIRGTPPVALTIKLKLRLSFRKLLFRWSSMLARARSVHETNWSAGRGRRTYSLRINIARNTQQKHQTQQNNKQLACTSMNLDLVIWFPKKVEAPVKIGSRPMRRLAALFIPWTWKLTDMKGNEEWRKNYRWGRDVPRR